MAACREVFLRGCRTSDLAIVEGTFLPDASGPGAASDFATLCRWLDLPRLAVVDARLLTECANDRELIDRLFLWTLARRPAPDELERVTRMFGPGIDRGEAASDLMWALLNTKEFAFNH